MKFLCTLMYAFIVVGFISSALGDLASGDLGNQTSAGGERVCNAPPVTHYIQDGVPNFILEKAVVCFREERDILGQGIYNSQTIEEYREVLKNSCAKVPTIVTCLSDVTEMAHSCLNETLSAFFVVFNRNVETLMNVSCENNGIETAKIVDELVKRRNDSEFSSMYRNCTNESFQHVRVLDFDNPSLFSVKYFRMIRDLKTCLGKQGRSVLIDLISSYFDDVLQELICIHPDTHGDVLCETFVDV